MKKLLLCAFVSVGIAVVAHSQINLSAGPYSQNFDTLATNLTTNPWVDNTTLAGWYAQSTNTTVVTTDYRADNGGANAGDLYSYGAVASTERALGSIASGTSGTIGYGLRIRNDTADVFGNITVSYTGEWWRNGGNASLAAQTLAFSYRTDALPITSPDVPGASSWTSFSALSFTTPTPNSAVAAPVDGNNPTNRISLSSVLTGVTLNPGDELFVRWIDLNDVGNDHGVALDDLSVSAEIVPEPSVFCLLGGFSLLAWNFIRRRQ